MLSNALTSYKTDFAGCVQCLHVKTYDKDRRAALERNRKYEEDPFDTIAKQKQFVPDMEAEYQTASAEHAKDTVAEDEFYFKGGEPLATDENELEEENYEKNLPNRRHRLRPIDYARLIKDHLINKRLDQAISLLEVRMLKQDRVKPDKYIYNLLISACAKAGQTSKAFSLFTKMRQRGLVVSGGTYTSLFNACANCANTTYALERLTILRENMLEKNIIPNIKHYNAMIKAYGRCGDLKTAFQLADELVERKLPITASTFNFLLQACASDIDYGFRHALLTWHKMLSLKLKPDYYSFKTMLRCVRDCGFGDMDHMQQVLQQIMQHGGQLTLSSGAAMNKTDSSSEQTLKNTANNKNVDSDIVNTAKNTLNTLVVENNDAEQLETPNLLLPRPHLGSLVALSEINHPHERFLLLGGISGYMDLMKSCHITPDIQLFTAMLDVVPPTYTAEKQIIAWIRRIGLKADIDFFNILIKKRSMRFDYEGAKEVLSMIRTAGLHPDIVTYGVLALGCQTPESARELLEEMRNNDVRMNIQILGAMLRQGCAQRNFPYIIEILQLALDQNIPPNDMFLQHLHKFYNQCARAIDSRVIFI